MVQQREPRILISFPEPLLAEIEDWRFAARMPSRSEAIRQLIRRGLDAYADDERADATREAAAGDR